MKNEKLINEAVEQLLNLFDLKTNPEIKVNLERNNNNFTLVIKGKLDNEFEDWCNQLDDDIFIEACERFEDETGVSLQEMSEHPDIELFKNVVAKVCKDKINILSKFI